METIFIYEFAQSGEEALEVIDDIVEEHDEVIYMVISDWLMPGMKGDELLKLVRSKVDDVKPILLTGHVDNKVVKKIEAEEERIVTIYKPWDEKHLMEVIKS